MKKYINLTFDDKGAPIIGAAKDNPTQGMAFVPTAWVPGGGGSGDEGSGLKSISISPVITTTPALDSVFPIYYDDLTDEEKEFGVDLVFESSDLSPGDYTITVTPTSDWYAAAYDDDGNTIVSESVGAPVEFTHTFPPDETFSIEYGAADDLMGETPKMIQIRMNISSGQ